MRHLYFRGGRGPRGQQGSTGAAGADGDPGATGPQGSAGRDASLERGGILVIVCNLVLTWITQG